MKRTLFWMTLLFAVLLCRTPTAEALTYGASNYRANKRNVLAGTYQNDPLYLFINEVETILAGTSAQTSIYLTPGSAPSSPAEGMLYYDSASNGLILRNNSQWVTIDTAGGTSLDGSYNLGNTIDVDGSAVTLTVSDNDNNRALDVVQNDVTNTQAAMLITNTGAGATAVGLDFAVTGTYDATGTNDNWLLAIDGTVTGVGLVAGASDITLENGGVINNTTNNEIEFIENSEEFSFAFNGNTLTLATDTGITTVDWGDLTTASGMTTITGDDATMTIGITATAAGRDVVIQQAGDQNSGILLDADGTSATDGIYLDSEGGILVEGAGQTITVTNATNTGADDITIQTTGATDSSIILSSAGTGGDAISLITSATTGDIKINSGDVLDIDAADDITVDLAGAAGEDILVTNTGGSIVLQSTESAEDSIVLQSTLGGINIQLDASGGSGEDIDITATGGSINILASEDDSAAIVISADGGTTERVTFGSVQGTNNAAVTILATAGGIDMDAAAAKTITIDGGAVNIASKTAGATAITLTANQGATDQMVITNTQGTNAAAIDIDATAGGIDIDAAKDFAVDLSAAGSNFDIDSVAGSVYLDGGEAAANAIVIDASNAAGGIDMDAGTAGFDLTVTGGDLTLQNTGAKDIVLDASAGRVLITGTESAADAIILTADGAAGEIALSANTGGVDIDAAGGTINLDTSGAGLDILLDATAGAVGIDGGETGANAIVINASHSGGGINMDCGSGGFDLTATGGDITLQNTTAKDIVLDATAGRVLITGTESAADAILLTADGAAGEIAMTAGTGGIDIDASSGDIKLNTSGNANDDITLTNATGTADTAIAFAATAGGITATVADEKNLILGNAASDAHVTVAASATAGNEDVRVINTNGTNAKAIEILASAGGVAIEGADEKAIYIGNDAKDAYVEVGASATAGDEDVRIINTNGTDEGAIVLTSTAGGIDLNANAAKDATINSGQILLTAAHNTADAILLHADAGASQTLRLVNDEGTSVTEGTNAVQLLATAGGVGIESNANLDDAIYILADGGTTTEITIQNDTGNTADSIEILSDVGGITLNASSGVVFTQGQTRKVRFDPKAVELDGTSPPALSDFGTDGQCNISSLEFDADPAGGGGDDIAYITWHVPDGYVVDSARLNVAYTFTVAEDAADEAQFDFAVNAIAAGEPLDGAGTALADQTTVISDASADNNKLHVSQYNIEVEDIAVDDMVTIEIAVDESESLLEASNVLEVLYFEIEWESTE